MLKMFVICTKYIMYIYQAYVLFLLFRTVCIFTAEPREVAEAILQEQQQWVNHT